MGTLGLHTCCKLCGCRIDGRASSDSGARQGGINIASEVNIACIALQGGDRRRLRWRCCAVSILNNSSNTRLSACILRVPNCTRAWGVPEGGRSTACDVKGRGTRRVWYHTALTRRSADRYGAGQGRWCRGLFFAFSTLEAWRGLGDDGRRCWHIIALSAFAARLGFSHNDRRWHCHSLLAFWARIGEGGDTRA